MAIDPGKSGALAVMTSEKIEVHPTPETEGDMVSLFMEISGKREPGETLIVYMEQLNGFAGGKGNPGSTMFTMAKYYFGWLFMCLTLGIRIQLVTPQRWQKDLNIGTRGAMKGLASNAAYALKRDWKNKLKAEAQRLFPMVDGITLKTCDALLILEYARKSNLIPEPKMPF